MCNYRHLPRRIIDSPAATNWPMKCSATPGCYHGGVARPARTVMNCMRTSETHMHDCRAHGPAVPSRMALQTVDRALKVAHPADVGCQIPDSSAQPWVVIASEVPVYPRKGIELRRPQRLQSLWHLSGQRDIRPGSSIRGVPCFSGLSRARRSELGGSVAPSRSLTTDPPSRSMTSTPRVR